MTPRMRLMLEHAAAFLKDGGDPFGKEFLGHYNITLDEALEMARLTAEAIKHTFNV